MNSKNMLSKSTVHSIPVPKCACRAEPYILRSVASSSSMRGLLAAVESVVASWTALGHSNTPEVRHRPVATPRTAVFIIWGAASLLLHTLDARIWDNKWVPSSSWVPVKCCASQWKHGILKKNHGGGSSRAESTHALSSTPWLRRNIKKLAQENLLHSSSKSSKWQTIAKVQRPSVIHTGSYSTWVCAKIG